MSQLIDEDLISLREARSLIPGRPHASTIYRLISRGTRGVRLDTVLVGGRHFTSKPAIRRFIEDVTAAAEKRLPLAAETTLVEKNIERTLDDAGI